MLKAPMNVKLITITPNAEENIVYCARVSSPQNQDNITTAPKLLKYLIAHQHWSPFEMVHMCVEIKTSRAISAQILRHKSFSFQEWSARYSGSMGFEPVQPRRQGVTNRQSSTDDLGPNDFAESYKQITVLANQLYENALAQGVAKESARMLLPMCTSTRLYMVGSARSWIHYLQLRCKEDTQLEHRDIANEIKQIFAAQFPVTSEALGWKQSIS